MAQASPDKSANDGRTAAAKTGGAKPAAQDQNNAMKRDDPSEAAAMTDPVAMLRADHRKVERLFDAFEKAENNGDKSHLAAEICKELMIHALLEEEIFYAACHDHMQDQPLDEAQVEHDGIKPLIIEIKDGSPEDQYFAAKVKVLSEDVKHHVHEEEKPDGILAKAKAAGIATPALAQQMAARKEALMAEAEMGRLRPPRTRSFRIVALPGMRQPAMRHESEARSYAGDYERGRSRFRDHDEDRHMPPRDEEGRFLSGRSRYEEDDERDYRRPRSRYQYEHEGDDRRMPPRDDEGRFRPRARQDDDDDYHGGRAGSRHGGQGSGWHGDPRGHSEAAHRGWEERSETRSRSRDDDERDGDHRGRSSHGGHGGWFGDPRGHAEAARRGWEEREHRGRFDDNDDDDRSSSRGRGRR